MSAPLKPKPQRWIGTFEALDDLARRMKRILKFAGKMGVTCRELVADTDRQPPKTADSGGVSQAVRGANRRSPLQP